MCRPGTAAACHPSTSGSTLPRSSGWGTRRTRASRVLGTPRIGGAARGARAGSSGAGCQPDGGAVEKQGGLRAGWGAGEKDGEVENSASFWRSASYLKSQDLTMHIYWRKLDLAKKSPGEQGFYGSRSWRASLTSWWEVRGCSR